MIKSCQLLPFQRDIKHCPKCDPGSWKRKAKKNVDIIKGSKNKIKSKTEKKYEYY